MVGGCGSLAAARKEDEVDEADERILGLRGGSAASELSKLAVDDDDDDDDDGEEKCSADDWPPTGNTFCSVLSDVIGISSLSEELSLLAAFCDASEDEAVFFFVLILGSASPPPPLVLGLGKLGTSAAAGAGAAELVRPDLSREK